MGKITDLVVAIIALLFAVYIFTRMGITLPMLVHDIKSFVFGSKGSFILFVIFFYIHTVRKAIPLEEYS